MKCKVINILGAIVGAVAALYFFGVLGGLEGDTFTFCQAVPRLIGAGVMALAGMAAANYKNDMEEEV